MRKKLKIKSNKMFLKSKINSKNSKYKSLKTARDINMHIKELKRNIKQESNINFVKFAGIWKNREISIKKLRENAWKTFGNNKY